MGGVALVAETTKLSFFVALRCRKRRTPPRSAGSRASRAGNSGGQVGVEDEWIKLSDVDIPASTLERLAGLRGGAGAAALGTIHEEGAPSKLAQR